MFIHEVQNDIEEQKFLIPFKSSGDMGPARHLDTKNSKKQLLMATNIFL